MNQNSKIKATASRVPVQLLGLAALALPQGERLCGGGDDAILVIFALQQRVSPDRHAGSYLQVPSGDQLGGLQAGPCSAACSPAPQLFWVGFMAELLNIQGGALAILGKRASGQWHMGE